MHKIIYLKKKFLYSIDNSIARGTSSIILWLIIFLSLIVMTMVLVVWLSGVSPDQTFLGLTWSFFNAALDSTPADHHLIYNISTFILFLTSLLVSGALIGALTNGLSDKLALLRDGHSNILESGHTVILGWSPHIYPMISEIIIADENKKKSVIVILGMLTKSEMMSEIKKNMPNTGKTKIICRHGDRRLQNDLSQVSLNTAKSIIISQHTDNPGDVPKCLLAIINDETRKVAKFHIVAVADSQEELEICQLIGKDEVEVIHASDFLARLEAQTCRQSGLPYVYNELLDFSGDEIYFQTEPKVYGKTYGEILNLYNNSAVIGLCSADNEIFINPDRETKAQDNFKIIAITEDDDTILLDSDNQFEIDTGAINDKNITKPPSEKYLILGWNSNTLVMLENLDSYAAPGSSVEVITSDKIFSQAKNIKLDNLRVTVRALDFNLRKNLEKIEFINYQCIILQGDNSLSAEDADTRTISTLIHLRDIRDNGSHGFSILSELFVGSNRDLIRSGKGDDFIISERIISSTVTQISENKLLARVFKELFVPEGSEIYLKPAENYIFFDAEVNFYTVIESALRKKETAIGYRSHQCAEIKRSFVGKKEMNFGVILNPEKNLTIKFSEGDSIIVLSEN
jgi:ion channel POLLUX/CASTOR